MKQLANQPRRLPTNPRTRRIITAPREPPTAPPTTADEGVVDCVVVVVVVWEGCGWSVGFWVSLVAAGVEGSAVDDEAGGGTDVS